MSAFLKNPHICCYCQHYGVKIFINLYLTIDELFIYRLRCQNRICLWNYHFRPKNDGEKCSRFFFMIPSMRAIIFTKGNNLSKITNLTKLTLQNCVNKEIIQIKTTFSTILISNISIEKKYQIYAWKQNRNTNLAFALLQKKSQLQLWTVPPSVTSSVEVWRLQEGLQQCVLSYNLI